MDLTEDDVFFIMKTFNSSDYESLDLKIKDFHIQISKSGGAHVAGAAIPSSASAQTASVLPNEPAPPSAVTPAADEQQAERAPSSDAVPVATDGLIPVVSPMIGTFYRSPSPGEAPFVQVGDTVKAGDPLCLIEVMKTYSTISAEAAGKIVQICASDSAMVQDKETLFLIEPTA